MKQLKAGTAKTEITTQAGCINDALYAKVLVLDDGDKKIAWISMDCICLGGGIGGFSDAITDRIKATAKEFGISFVLCGTTHTHTPFEMTLTEDGVLSRIKTALRDASANMQCVKMGYAVGHENSFCINRTLNLKDGTASTIRQAHPCPQDEDIAEISYYDDRVRVLKIDALNGSPLCVVFTFGCHPLLGYANNGVTANFPGVAERLIQQETGAMAMFFQNCGGDVIEKDFKNFDIPKCCETAGNVLAKEVLRVLKTIQTEKQEISVAEQPVMFPLKRDFAEVKGKLLERREELFASLQSCPLDFKKFLPLYMKYLISPEYPLDYAYAYMKEEQDGKNQLRMQDVINRANIDKYLENVKAMEELSTISAKLWTINWHEEHNASYGKDAVEAKILGVRIGDTMLVTAPVEPLSEIARRIERLSPLPETFVIGYANGYFHYGAPREVYNNGGYETYECMLAPEWEESYEKAVKELIDQLISKC